MRELNPCPFCGQFGNHWAGCSLAGTAITVVQQYPRTNSIENPAITGLEARVRELEAELAQAQAQWVTYDGTAETRPPAGVHVLFTWGRHYTIAMGAFDPGQNIFVSFPGGQGFWDPGFQPGDLWAYLPSIPAKVRDNANKMRENNVTT